MYTNIIHNDDICNYFLKNQQFIFNSLGNCRECRMHKRKIDMADEIYVINVGGYIGSSTRSEIEYARSQGKRIKYLEEA